MGGEAGEGTAPPAGAGEGTGQEPTQGGSCKGREQSSDPKLRHTGWILAGGEPR